VPGAFSVGVNLGCYAGSLARNGQGEIEETMTIQVNQEEMEWQPNMTVQDVLVRRKYTFPMIVVKVNDVVVQKEAYDSFLVPNGADVKVIHLISGG
jgi:sulfur carrier protein